MPPYLRGGGHIVFGADPVGVCVTLFCQHIILWTGSWILNKFTWIYNLGITKKWLDLSDLDLIVKVTAVEKLKIHSRRPSVFSENTVTSLFLLSESTL